jgi:hypothetical protein
VDPAHRITARKVGEPPCPRGCQPQQLGVVAGIEQDLSRDALGDLGVYTDLAGRSGAPLTASMRVFTAASRKPWFALLPASSPIAAREAGLWQRSQPSTAAPASPACRVAPVQSTQR